MSRILSTGGGACMVAGGHAWLPGGMYGCGGMFMVAGGHAWLLGVCVVVGVGVGVWLWRGMHGCLGGMYGCGGGRVGHVWLWGGGWGMCGCRECASLLEGMRGCWGGCIGYDEIRSMSGRYASYWNAFLLLLHLKNIFYEIWSIPGDHSTFGHNLINIINLMNLMNSAKAI